MSNSKLLAIVGHQGCGSTQYARKLASERGTYVEVAPDDLVHRLSSILSEKPAVVILEEAPSTSRQMAALKTLIRTDTLLIKQRSGEEVRLPSPFVIVTTNDSSFASLFQREAISTIRIGNAGSTLH